MPSAAQFTYFAAFMGAGIFFLFVAITVFLPVIILVRVVMLNCLSGDVSGGVGSTLAVQGMPRTLQAPAKFASAFTLGSALMMASFFALKGFQTQLSYMMEKERLVFSIGAQLAVLLTDLHDTSALLEPL